MESLTNISGLKDGKKKIEQLYRDLRESLKGNEKNQKVFLDRKTGALSPVLRDLGHQRAYRRKWAAKLLTVLVEENKPFGAQILESQGIMNLKKLLTSPHFCLQKNGARLIQRLAYKRIGLELIKKSGIHYSLKSRTKCIREDVREEILNAFHELIRRDESIRSLIWSRSLEKRMKSLSFHKRRKTWALSRNILKFFGVKKTLENGNNTSSFN